MRYFLRLRSMFCPSLNLRLVSTLLMVCCGISTNAFSETIPEGLKKDPSSEMESKPGLTATDAIVLGVVEGLTEYLPVSSTGHLILADHLLDQRNPTTSHTMQEARNAYLIVIQGGAILAVLLLYWRKLLAIAMGLLGRDAEGLSLGLKILLAFLPAAFLGLLLNDWIESSLFNPNTVAIGLVIGSVIMVLAEWYRKQKPLPESSVSDDADSLQQLSYRGAMVVGCMQCLALCPGMSRSMVTIVGGYLAGLSAKSSAEFSFLLGFLTLSAASLYSLLRSWDAIVTTLEPGPVLLGIAVATVVAFLAVKWFVAYLSKHGLIVFAFYRIAVAGAIWWFLSRS